MGKPMPTLDVFMLATILRETKPVYADFVTRLGNAAMSAYTTAHDQWLESLKATTYALLEVDPDIDASAFIGASGGAH